MALRGPSAWRPSLLGFHVRLCVHCANTALLSPTFPCTCFTQLRWNACIKMDIYKVTELFVHTCLKIVGND